MAVRPINGLSLCSGVGGLDRGLTLAMPGYRAVCHVEREAYAAAVLVARMADGSMAEAPIWDDLRTFDGSAWRGSVDILTAGYPCQPFSLAGVRRGEDDPRHIWPEVARIIDEARPVLVFCENVSGHLSLGFDSVCEDMEGMGYRVAAVVATAWAVGAPHIRERLFWLGVADSDGSEWRTNEQAGGHREQGNEGGRVKNTGEPGILREGRGATNPDSDPLRLQRRRAEPGAGSPVAGHDGPWDWGQAPPAVCGVDDGVANRVDRLRAIGNGVVPQCAAKAFETLMMEIDD